MQGGHQVPRTPGHITTASHVGQGFAWLSMRLQSQRFWYYNNFYFKISIDMYFLDKGALIIGFADKRPLIQRALL